jgi:hypothetical protein
MANHQTFRPSKPSHRRWHDGRLRRTVIASVAVGVLLGPVLVNAAPSAASGPIPRVTAKAPQVIYPSGIRDAVEPSGEAPPGPKALPGYALTYTQDFTGQTFPSDWGKFAGVPSGDSTSRWSGSHVLMGGGVVRLIAWRDPQYKNDWVTGGMCQCAPGEGHTYGAYFIRSRVTGPGPDENELLWPVAPVWPPEVDINEMGWPTNKTSWTVHYGHGYSFVQTTKKFNMLRWHTWGVIWTPKSLTFTIDGKAWGHLTSAAEIPHQAMTLDIQQETYCNSGIKDVNACPKHQVALQIDWVAEYRLR